MLTGPLLAITGTFQLITDASGFEPKPDFWNFKGVSCMSEERALLVVEREISTLDFLAISRNKIKDFSNVVEQKNAKNERQNRRKDAD